MKNIVKFSDVYVYIHAFETSKYPFGRLQGLFQSTPNVLNNLAASNMIGRTQLFASSVFRGINATYEQSGGTPEEIEAIQLDEYVSRQNLECIDFVKSDTEEHESLVI